MVWPLLRPFLCALSMIVIAFSLFPALFSVSTVQVHVFGVTYDFQHNGNPAYLSACFDDVKTYLCPAAAVSEVQSLCPSLTQLRIAGLIYFGMSCLVLLVQLADLLQVVLHKSQLFSATTKCDVYGLSPVIFALNLVIYALVAGAFTEFTDVKPAFGAFLAILAEALLLSFALVALILERKEEAHLQVREPLLPTQSTRETQP